MVVADDHVYALALRKRGLFDRFDAAVDSDDKLHVVRGSPFDAFLRHAVALVVAVGDVEVHIGGEPAEERVEKRNGGGAVHIVVAVDQYLLAALDRTVEPVDRLVHVVQKERIVDVFEAWTEELPRLVEGLHASFHEEVGKHLVDAHLRAETLNLLRVGGFPDFPNALFVAHLYCFIFLQSRDGFPPPLRAESSRP